MNPAQEVTAFSGRFEKRCREKGWLHALFHAGVLADIASDLRRWLLSLGADARRARQDSLQAEDLMKQGYRLMAVGDYNSALTHFRKAGALIDKAAGETETLSKELTA